MLKDLNGIWRLVLVSDVGKNMTKTSKANNTFFQNSDTDYSYAKRPCKKEDRMNGDWRNESVCCIKTYNKAET